MGTPHADASVQEMQAWEEEASSMTEEQAVHLQAVAEHCYTANSLHNLSSRGQQGDMDERARMIRKDRSVAAATLWLAVTTRLDTLHYGRR